MAVNFPIPAYFMAILIISRLMSLGIAQSVFELAATDFGHIVKLSPKAIHYPSSPEDIADLIKSSYSNSEPFTIAAKGNGHSIRGQAMASNGVVVNMTYLRMHRSGSGIQISNDGSYADVGGEQLWIDVLNSTLERGVAPVSWTDYLYLTVGGTLSNAGISGETFRFGPQISNVHEVDVVTGKGDTLTCSANSNSDLFYAVLGGLGQFGVITRARIPLAPAPKRSKWVRMLYNDFSAFTRDQELLISKNGREDKAALDYLEGSLMMDQTSPDIWKSFFPPADHPRIISLITQNRIIYSLEVVKNYDDQTGSTIDQDLQQLLKGLSYVPGFLFEKDVQYIEFLNRVRGEELALRSQGLWDVPHPWLNLFIPKSRIADFNEGVFKGIVLQRNITTGIVLVYPMNRQKWDEKMSAVIPDEEIFYTVGFLQTSGFDNWQTFDEQNKELLQFCDKNGLGVKQYLPHYTTKEEWSHHFGSKWETFQQRKNQFDPKMLLSPGQSIFNNN